MIIISIMDFVHLYIQEAFMARTVGIGVQSFEVIRENQYFYIDKSKRRIRTRVFNNVNL